MSEDLTQRVIELEQRVCALEDAKVSVMIGEVKVDSQPCAEELVKCIKQVVSDWYKAESRAGGVVHSLK